jgi:sialic acid synthase
VTTFTYYTIVFIIFYDMIEQMKKYKTPRIIAEIGCNHKGDFDTAKELIRLAKSSGAHVAKFQTRHSKTLLTDEQYNRPHPVPENAYGGTYGAHREFLEFDIAQHAELKAYCEKIKITYSTSVWDIPSAKAIMTLNPDFIKIPSACNNNLDMLELLISGFNGDIHLSVGMTTQEEEEIIVSLFEKQNASQRLVLYSCTSGYPVDFKDICLLEITRLIKRYKHRTKAIGFSGHHGGIAADIAAYTLGAEWIERHFTKDRTWKGTDHAASLEPSGFTKLCRDLKHVHKALTVKKKEILDVESVQRDKLKYRP